jgi:hypothetical protein
MRGGQFPHTLLVIPADAEGGVVVAVSEPVPWPPATVAAIVAGLRASGAINLMARTPAELRKQREALAAVIKDAKQ